MRALITTGTGDLRLDTVPTLEPGPGDVRIAVGAAAVNPIDIATRDGMFHGPVVPAGTALGLGWDVSGTIDAVGDGAPFAVGNRVAALRGNPTTPLGTYSDLVVLPASAVTALPDGIDTVDAASLPLNLSTADQALSLAGAPTSLLITGAAGAVGGFAVVLAAKNGWTVTALGRESDRAFLESAGASRVITDLVDAGAHDVVLDAAVLGSAAFTALRDGGTYIGVIPSAIPDAERDITTTAVAVQPDGPRLGELLGWVVDGSIEVRVAGSAPLTQARKAQDEASTSGTRGRWLLVP